MANSTSDPPPLHLQDWEAGLAHRPDLLIIVRNDIKIVVAVDANMIFTNRSHGVLLTGMRYFLLIMPQISRDLILFQLFQIGVWCSSNTARVVLFCCLLLVDVIARFNLAPDGDLKVFYLGEFFQK